MVNFLLFFLCATSLYSVFVAEAKMHTQILHFPSFTLDLCSSEWPL